MVQTKRALTAAWIALVLLTMVSFFVAESAGLVRELATLFLMAIAGVKGVIVLVRFMGVRALPVSWRIFFGAWLLITAGVIVGFNFASGG